MINITKTKILSSFRVVMPLLGILLLAACSSPRVELISKETAISRSKEPLLIISPLSPEESLKNDCEQLGNFFLIAISSRIKGQITYSGNIESLKKAVNWGNLINNGTVNVKEVATISRTIGCNSAVTIRILDFKRYPPFRMVVEVLWIDSLSNIVLGRLYDDIDMTNTDTSYKFNNYVGDGPARTTYETFTYAPYQGISQTASLKPSTFMNFVADSCAEAMFGGETLGISSWWYWRIF